MSLREAIRAALAELGRHATADEVRKWCSDRGVEPSDSFERLLMEEKTAIRAALMEESHERLAEELRKLDAELEERIRLRESQLRALGVEGESVFARAVTPAAFRELPNRRAAVAVLPLRVQVLLAAEWVRSVLHVLLDAHPGYLRPQHALDAVTRWAFHPTDANAAQLRTFARPDGERPIHLFGTAPRHAARAVDAVVRAANQAATDGECAEAVADCGTLAVRGTPSASYALLDARWKWLFTIYRHALGPGVPFDPQWRTSTALALAQGIVRDRALDRMPILADALRDAGCVEEALGHLQNENEGTLADWTMWNLLHLGESQPAQSRDGGKV